MAHATALLADPIGRDHLAGRSHPECPERFDAVLDGLREAGLLDRLVPIQPRGCLTVLGGRCASSIPVLRGIVRSGGFVTRSTP
jgi:hypothetical protein